MPSTNDLTELVKGVEKPWILSKPVVGLNNYYLDEERVPLVQYVSEIIGNYYEEIDFERYIHTLEMLYSLTRAYREGTADIFKMSLAPFINISPHTFPIFNFGINVALDEIYEVIYNAVASICENTEFTRDNYWYRNFWEKLNEKSEVKAVTINYDDTIERVLPYHKNGFEENIEDGLYRFDPKSFYKSITEDPIVINLHGSIHFGYFPTDYRGKGMREPRDYFIVQNWDDLYYFENHNEAYNTWGKSSRSQNVTQSGEEARIGPIITGLRKLDKLTAMPYQHYFSSLYSLIYECSKVIIIGYGFNDIHINNWLIRVPHSHGTNRKILVITCKPDEFCNWQQLDLTHQSEILTLASLSKQPEPPGRDFHPELKFVKSDDECCGIWFDGFKSFVENGFEEGLEFLGLE